MPRSVRKLIAWSLATSLGTLALVGHALHSGHHHAVRSAAALHEHDGERCHDGHHHHGHQHHGHAEPATLPESADGFATHDGALDHECAVCQLLGQLQQGATPAAAELAVPLLAVRYLPSSERVAATGVAARYSSRAPPELA